MERKEISRLLTLLKIHFSNGDEPTPVEIDAWHMALATFSSDAVSKAYQGYLGEGHAFPPNVGQLMFRAKKIMFPLLSMTPEQHEAEKSPLWIEYNRKHPSPSSQIRMYNPWGNPADYMPRDDTWWRKEAMNNLKVSIEKLTAAPIEKTTEFFKKLGVESQAPQLTHDESTTLLGKISENKNE